MKMISNGFLQNWSLWMWHHATRTSTGTGVSLLSWPLFARLTLGIKPVWRVLVERGYLSYIHVSLYSHGEMWKGSRDLLIMPLIRLATVKHKMMSSVLRNLAAGLSYLTHLLLLFSHHHHALIWPVHLWMTKCFDDSSDKAPDHKILSESSAYQLSEAMIFGSSVSANKQ